MADRPRAQLVNDAEVIVVGLGAMGSMALWRLAQRGVDVLGIEQFEPGHALGSSHGETRLFRTACFEHPELATMAIRSRTLWRDLELASGEELLTRSGGIMIGLPGSELIRGTAEAARVGGVVVERLDNSELRSRFPQHSNLDPSHVGLWDPMAGVVRPEAGVVVAIKSAQLCGARVVTGTRVVDIHDLEDGVEVRTKDRLWRARTAIVAAGPWLANILPEIPAVAYRVPMTWYRPKVEGQEFTLDNFPVFIRHIDSKRTMWGHGSTGGHPVKVGAPDDPSNFTSVNPDTVDRTISSETTVGSAVVREFIKGLVDEPVSSRICMVTQSPDGQFLLGRASETSSILVAGGCSGHAFKHAPGIGELLAQLTLNEKPYLDASFVDPRRFVA
jgi:sarcosine oxidase